MKKICAVLCVLLALGASCFAESTGIWQLKYYVDEFKLPTDEAYITTFLPIEGTFCNSAVDDALLNVSIVIDEDSFAFVLYEYGDNKVKNSYSKPVSYNIIMLDDARNKTNLTGAMNSGSDRIYLDAFSAFIVNEALINNLTLSFYIEEVDAPSTNYLFTINDTQVFSAIFEGLNASAKEKDYQEALTLFNSGNYEEALSIFASLNGYKDSNEWYSKYQAIKYEEAEILLADGKKANAALAFYKISDYKDAKERSSEIWRDIADDKTIFANFASTMALKEDGTVVYTGFNSNGEADVDNWTRIVAIAHQDCSNYPIGIRESGAVFVSGSLYPDDGVSEWTNIVAASGGNFHIAGLKADGTVVAAGFNEDGRCDVKHWKDIISISCGSSHTAGLRADGTVVIAGKDGKSSSVSGWNDIVEIFAEGNYACTIGLKADGTVVIAGLSDYHDAEKWDSISNWSNIKTIACSTTHALGLREDGTVVATGKNNYKQCNVSDWTDIVAIACNDNFSVGLKADGTVVAAGNNEFGQCSVSDWTDIVAIDCGQTHTVGLRADGTIVTVGNNEYGQCDVSNWSNIKLPNGLEPRVVYSVLQQGSKGDSVKALQEKMIELGALTGSADGDYGKMTATAVAELQKQFGMEETGIADSDFQTKLFKNN